MVVIKLTPVGMLTAGRSYLRSFDVDANGGRGSVLLTKYKGGALKFGDLTDAMNAWRSQSTVLPLRPDGEPNRPLTAYHAIFEHV